MNKSFLSARNSVVFTGGVLLLLVSILIIQQKFASTRRAAETSRFNKTDIYSYPNNYKQEISHYYTYHLDSINQPDVHNAIGLNKAGKFIKWDKPGMPFNLGMQRYYVWFYLPIKNEGTHEIALVWQLLNNTDTVQLFCKTNDQVYGHPMIPFYKPLHQRPLSLRASFDTIWLKPGEQKELYLHVWKNAYNTYMPQTVLPLPEFLQQEGFTSNIYCVYIAVFAFIILFNFFLFISLRDVVHLWYPCFIFNVSMGLLLEANYDIFLFPDFVHHIFCLTINTPFADFSLLCTARVMQILLQQKRTNSIFWLAITAFLTMDFIWGISQLLSAAWCINNGGHYPYIFFRIVSDVLLWGTTALLVCSIIEKVIQRQPLARIYLFTTMLPVLGLLNYFMNGLGITNFLVLYPNGFAVGIMIEILVLTMLLTQRYNGLQQEKNQLLNRQLELQIETIDRVAETIENEQKRIAADLHDGVGSFLTALRLMVNKSIHYFSGNGQAEAAQTLTAVQLQIDKAVADIRSISHNLMPIDFEHYQFSEIIKNHLTTISTITQLRVEYYLDEQINNVSKNIQITLYRIFTEVMNNAVKHSQSSHITVQFIYHGVSVQMQVIDEGMGFAQDATSSGIGLKNVQSRVNFLKGKLTIDSSKKGTTLIVEIPINP